jgi:hypothetical protein
VDGAILAEAARLVEAGKLMPQVDPRQCTMETILDAYEAMRSRTAWGKLAIDIANHAPH